MNNKTITIGEVRLSYCNLFVPKPPFNNPAGEPKFSTTILVPKSNLQAKAAIDAAINAAIEEGVGKCWKGVRPPVPAICVHDGDGARPSDGSPFGEECKGCWVFTASCKPERAPFVVDGNVQPIIQQSEIYSGVYGNVNVSFFAYENSGKKGIGCGLNGFQKTRDGEPLGSSISAAEAFGTVTPAAPTYPQQALILAMHLKRCLQLPRIRSRQLQSILATRLRRLPQPIPHRSSTPLIPSPDSPCRPACPSWVSDLRGPFGPLHQGGRHASSFY